MTDQQDHDQKEIMKQAIKEWMDERYSEVGRWFVKTAIVGAVTTLFFWYIQARGFKLP